MMGPDSDLIGSDYLSRGKHEGSGMHRGRAVIGEGAGSRQIVGRSGHGGTSEQEGEGEDEAEGPHQSVSKIIRQAPFAGQLDTQGLFPDICTKRGKWFRGWENCFAGTVRTKYSEKKLNGFRIAASRTRGLGQ
jgi:hypothetical protein